MQPIQILLSAGIRTEHYVNAIRALGAEPIAKYLPETDTHYDGLILCGGSDMDPKYYNEPICGSRDIDLARDENELALLKAYYEAGKPILGICRGHQLINVFFGGSLIQDMKEAAQHTRKNDVDQTHEVTACGNSVLTRLYGERFSVNSAHHQAIGRLGKGLRATAYWQNDCIEAIEHEQAPILAVQWHPERMCFLNAGADTVDGAKLLRYFIDLCKANKDTKS